MFKKYHVGENGLIKETSDFKKTKSKTQTFEAPEPFKRCHAVGSGV